MKTIRLRAATVLFFLLTTLTAFSATEKFLAASDAAKVVIAFSAKRVGNFLSEPGNVPIEFLRRAGREINKTWPVDQSDFLAASLFSTELMNDKTFLRPVSFNSLSTEQKKEAQALLDRYGSETENLLQQIRPDDNCMFLQIVAEAATIAEIFRQAAANEQNPLKLKPEQVEKVNYQLLPILEASDYFIGAVVLSNKGFEGQFRIKSLDGKLASPKTSHALSIGEFINSESLMVFAQTHPIEDPAATLQELKKMPQTIQVLSMIASAGLDFEKDILRNSARESILYLNFEPDKESGMPDIRFVAPVPDIKHLEANLDKLKQLCVQTGIFVNFPEGRHKVVKLSHFMLPQYGIYAGLSGRFLILASSQEKLYDEMDFLKAAAAGKVSEEPVEEGLQRYWRIGFAEFNLQLQKFLQSPLMADKGVPPIPNLRMLDDLDDLTVLTRLKPESIDFSIFLLVKEYKEK